jgi:hypothetical protein
VVLTTCAWNGDPSIAYAIDGALTATVHVNWWVGSARIDCGHAPGTCAVGISSADRKSDFAPLGVPIAFDPARRPTITVTPTDSLIDGQTVTVQGRNIGEGTVHIQQCLLPFWASCVSVDAASGPDGTFSTAMTVRRSFEWGGHGPGSGACGVDGDCVVDVSITPKWRDTGLMRLTADRPVAIEFRPVPTTTTMRRPDPSTTTGGALLLTERR